MKEFWRQYKGTRYEVSNTGRVRTMPNKDHRGRIVDPGRILINQIREDGKAYVSLKINGKQTMRAVHKMMAEVFLKKPDGAITVIFKDGNPDILFRGNIKWRKPKKRNSDELFGLARSRYKRGMDHWSNKKKEYPLTDEDVERIIASKDSARLVADIYGISERHVYRIRKGESRALPTPYKNSIIDQQKI